MVKILLAVVIGTISLTALADQVSGVPTYVDTTTSTYLFDESINYQVGFSISQEDSRLSDLFGPKGSELCGPTSLANSLAYLKYWRKTPFSNIIMSQDPLQGDFSQVVRDLSKRCNTDYAGGTLVVDMRSCIQQLFKDSGYQNSDVKVIGSIKTADISRAVSIDDIRNYVKSDYGVLLEVTYFTFDSNTKTWVSTNGHYVSVVGFDYDLTWSDREVHLKIINPDVDYRMRDANSRWDSIEMLKIPRKTGEVYPAMSNYILDGNFRGVIKRAFVKNLIVFKPQ